VTACCTLDPKQVTDAAALGTFEPSHLAKVPMDMPSSCVLPTQAIVDCIDGYVRDNDLNPTVTDPLVVDHQVTISWPVVLSLMTIIASYLRNVPSIQSEQSFFGANFRMIVFIYMAYNWMLALSVTMEEIIVTKNLG
jgi:hypothetical protein